MNYQEAIDYIHGTNKFGRKHGLDNIRTLLSYIGNPHENLEYVHVAGTNGKGSTVSFISGILRETGIKVGMYTSPFIERFTERIKINDVEISENDLTEFTNLIIKAIEMMKEDGFNHPTEFEIITAIAFLYFKSNNCDVVILEVGLGGRLDATNIIDNPLLSVITTINYDHTNILGNKLSQIAFEKAGIIKTNGTVLVMPQAEEVMSVFIDVSEEKKAKLYICETSKIIRKNFSINGQTFDYKNFKNLEISLIGDHQTINAIMAIEAAILISCYFNITEKNIRDGLKKAKWPGRLEILSKNPIFIIDGAHNAEGAKGLVNALKKYFPDKKIICIIGVLIDKEVKSILKELNQIIDTYLVIRPDSERALDPEILKDIIIDMDKRAINVGDINNAVNIAKSMIGKDTIAVACGSLYYIGKIRTLFT